MASSNSMIKDSSKLQKGQMLKVNLSNVNDRLPKELLKKIQDDPLGRLVGYKMVDGNQFALVIKFRDASSSWFFENELCEIEQTD